MNMKTNLNIIWLIASLRVKPITLGMQKMKNSRILKTIAIIDVKITRLGNTFDAFTIPQTAKS